MKRVSNWVFGSFFRSIGRILAFLLLGLAFIYLSDKFNFKLPSLLIDNVKAANIPINTSMWASQWCIDDSCDYTVGGSTYYRDYLAMGGSNSYTNTNRYLLTAIRLRDTFTSSNYLQSGTQYQVRFKIWFSPLYNLNEYNFSQSDIDFYVTDSGNNQTEVTQDNFTCTFSRIVNTDSFFLTCYFIPTSSIKQIYIRLKFNYTLYTQYPLFELDTLNVSSSAVSYNSGTQEAIQEQTTAINNGFNNMISSINNLFNSQNENSQELLNSINDDNTTGATGTASNFFGNFNTDTHGLTSIITAPLSAIQSLSSTTCQPLELPLPFVDNNLTLPCMRPIYEENFGGFMDLYDAITIGIVSYWVMVRIFALVKDFKNPDHDEIEVVDL